MMLDVPKTRHIYIYLLLRLQENLRYNTERVLGVRSFAGNST